MVAEERTFEECVAELEIISDSDNDTECPVVHIKPQPSKIRILDNVLLGSGTSRDTSTSSGDDVARTEISVAETDVSAMIETFIKSVVGTEASEAVDSVVKELMTKESSQLNAAEGEEPSQLKEVEEEESSQMKEAEEEEPSHLKDAEEEESS
ncbi:hypothetical protein Zmor_027965 [Zophobas morio]|uniref:Uncharacterized protein n=1 Tax=Zophobas morio TaxID=2755281 RepID=A0AA38HPM6_9CUCU|nr:hypothetical protein Zmor_027965 [Zophobas morio]